MKRDGIASLALLWPAFVAASACEFSAALARQFIGRTAEDAVGEVTHEPPWATQNTIALELETLRLRDFSLAPSGVPTLICAPFALHDASIVDFAPGHSLVETLRGAGVERLFVTHWRSASDAMRFLSINAYLADLNVVIDELGGKVDLIGPCSGGWMALVYAARFPRKVRKLVLAGAPIDVSAGESPISRLVSGAPLSYFEELVKLGEGRILGDRILALCSPELLEQDAVHRLLQPQEPIDSPEFHQLETRFREWYASTVNLPGTYYLQVVERLFRENQIATGHFVALGQRIDLATVRAPLYLVAAREDELVAPAQLLATERLVGSPPERVHKTVAPCTHFGLFMGRQILADVWTPIGRWLSEPTTRAHGKARGVASETAHTRAA